MATVNKYIKLANTFITTATFTNNNKGNNNNKRYNEKHLTYTIMQNFKL